MCLSVSFLSRGVLLILVHVQVLLASDDVPELQYIVFLNKLAECQGQSDLFARHGRNRLRGCVSAVDGIAVRIRRPSVRDAPNYIAY